MKVNYVLRPAKNVERKMLVELARRLDGFGDVSRYEYVGFGSYFFSDFRLVHRVLGITAMTSIERLTSQRARFEFNKPLEYIEIQFGEASSILPALSWKGPKIIWLDYECPLTSTVLSDIAVVLSRAQPGSMLIVTIQANPLGKKESAIDAISENIGPDRVDASWQEKSFAGLGTCSIYYDVIRRHVAEEVLSLNIGCREYESLSVRQVGHFRYEDDAQMMSLAWVVHNAAQEPLYASCGFQTVPFYRSGSEAYSIRLPNVTYREMRLFDLALKSEDANIFVKHGLTIEQLQMYKAIQRYFPMFTEAEL